jgi:GR25 family glycosyltransferase involved in LPS biosynthesis
MVVPPCYVITLGTDFPNRKSLQSVGLNPILFKGVDARKDEHLKYPEYVEQRCQDTCPKTAIGCGLSHVLLAEKLFDEGHDIALVLEDDAYPKVQNFDFDEILEYVPDDWEIIKLHSDLYSKDNTYNTYHASTAAYIINRKGMYKLKNTKVSFHIDYQISYMTDIKIYKSRVNMFATDETTSINREDSSIHWHTYFRSKFTTGEKTELHSLSYKFFRIPGTSIEISPRQVLDGVLVLVIFFIVYNVCRASSRL